ncbi:uroporphyrinogen-III synthase [Methermicoccus shengliensis]|uniref:Uroporphyrinogen-III synthase n=1 Tax=Methermicoccus shengliensis TaxID=660064 RepID=A0A832RYB5_9EURY|nr:uroporphyrinogen-III synthase [Methermicoccus shengliensis]KUK04167.1 MAG: Uroporphyrinogen-III synthase [Euryarchaeota archaeon 55_53]KUK29908.1 MAG: Uroporphyrinogen-III synthase [Methanosarcinales archeaon 56_1174]MDI3488356.1 uroporphyrinogen-III synthase [Methanosarcinales archaeon]MDN5295831.1 uroporphyrinogen-III synthase [Methanosarcinales archaeon]HIH70064.1 uroporphyrinogen-III synthase [Methermicoccus shengliensis]
MRVGVMRPERYERECARVLARTGARMVFVPFIEIRPTKGRGLEDAVARLREGVSSTAVFTSANGVDIAFSQVGESLSEVLSNVDVVAIGPRTKKALAEREVVCRLPPTYTSEGICELLSDVEGGIEVLRSAHGDAALVERLARHHLVHECVLYTIAKLCGEPQHRFLHEVVGGGVDVLLFTSRMMVESFFECAQKAGVLDDLMRTLPNIEVVAIGPPTKRALASWGIGAKMPKEHSFSAMVELLEGGDD